MEIPKHYDPKAVEDKIYNKWLEGNYFHAEPDEREPYTVVIPPPNVTSVLHLGHALNNTIQDILVRWKRMSGYNTEWMPGTDHAGIATQNVVEKVLAKEGKTKHDLGREKFVERVWKWKEEHGSAIISQLKKLGCSCDWQRERFTLDPGLSDAVQEVFIRLYNKELIYRGNYIVNWCPRCLTAISDEEVDYKNREGKLWYIRYPLKDSDEHIVVATTRPETMLGDVAVAMSPIDPRYKKLKGRIALLPILNRELVFIADEFVDPQFGTGMVKVTPAHDPNDFAMANRHKLTPINIMDPDGKMNEVAGPYKGMDRFECRKAILKDLEAKNLLEKIEKHDYAVGSCYRCETIIEPRLSYQWFVKMEPLAKPAIKAAEEGKVIFTPKRWTGVYLNWLKNIHDWCISRQLWWGHQIPVFYCDACGHIMVAKKAPSKCEKCNSIKIHQDPDVLDTWFSSWLWPFTTFGWPNDNKDLEYFYPTSTLVTGADIIFFWVARMIMAGLEFTGEVPFESVFLNGIIRDPQGRKMSKSLGNTIDPLEIINEYGADALRFTMMMCAQGQDIYISKESFETGRNFCNKIWNASRFLLTNITSEEGLSFQFDSNKLTSDDIYILGKLNEAIGTVTSSLKKFRFNEAISKIYEFFWHSYCDKYIEYAKGYLAEDKKEDRNRTASILVYVLMNILKLMHPFLPFITEEIWSLIPGKTDGMLIIADWAKKLHVELPTDIIRNTELKYDLITAGRNLRKEYNIGPGRKLKYIIRAVDDTVSNYLQRESANLTRMLNADSVTIKMHFEPDKPMPSAVTTLGEIFMSIEGEIDIKAEHDRLQKELDKTRDALTKARHKLRNPSFVEKAPAQVVEKAKALAKELADKAEKLEQTLKYLT